ncbi:protein-S-isoprenylcysteine O-methyltransferase-like [Tropilaelaps mercedesae]|uniref:Protein-S-isoprenylcysteine O-methyltransferase n=1 Tax=Tropilaelaps mercedesae TaxID=418985 RepID=A0A1V9X092_9ACAR|nr:protein-S-isoprenylcysteine O-methyltransferase-like [Tropilaelaps mercedesae]
MRWLADGATVSETHLSANGTGMAYAGDNSEQPVSTTNPLAYYYYYTVSSTGIRESFVCVHQWQESIRNLNLNSFLLNHSKEYHIAMVASWFEYFAESYFYPELKTLGVVAWTGLTLCALGEALRKCAMLTAGSNFHHLVRVKREEDHELVTSGVYSICRHPSYAGWFLWSVGTQDEHERTSAYSFTMEPSERAPLQRERRHMEQKAEIDDDLLLLANPVCLVAYTMVTWMFFRERVEEEEITLLEFFGEEYAAYQKRVATGLPFIKGFKMEL